MVLFGLSSFPQAPWQLVFGPSWAYTCAQAASGSETNPSTGDSSSPLSCTLPRLLGICRLAVYHFIVPGLKTSSSMEVASPMHNSTGRRKVMERETGCLSAFLASPLMCDVVIWVLLRLHARIVASTLFAQVRQVTCTCCKLACCKDTPLIVHPHANSTSWSVPEAVLS